MLNWNLNFGSCFPGYLNSVAQQPEAFSSSMYIGLKFAYCFRSALGGHRNNHLPSDSRPNILKMSSTVSVITLECKKMPLHFMSISSPNWGPDASGSCGFYGFYLFPLAFCLPLHQFKHLLSHFQLFRLFHSFTQANDALVKNCWISNQNEHKNTVDSIFLFLPPRRGWWGNVLSGE